MSQGLNNWVNLEGPLENIGPLSFVEERCKCVRRGEPLFSEREFLSITFRLFGAEVAETWKLLSLNGNNQEARELACERMNALAMQIPENIMAILAVDLVFYLRERNRKISPTKVLDISCDQSMLSRAIAQLFSEPEKECVAIDFPIEIKKGDNVLLTSFCLSPLDLKETMNSLPPMEKDYTMCEYMAAVINPTGSEKVLGHCPVGPYRL